MKKWVLFFLFSVIITVFPGCSKVEPQRSTEIPLNKISLNEAPFKVQEWAKPLIGSPNLTWMQYEDRTYLIVARGKRNTGGYTVKIQTAEIKDKDLVVTYTINDPKPDQMVTQAITFPYDLGWITKTDLSIRFEGPDLFNSK